MDYFSAAPHSCSEITETLFLRDLIVLKIMRGLGVVFEFKPTVQAFSCRVDYGEVIARASSDHQVKWSPLFDLTGETRHKSTRGVYGLISTFKPFRIIQITILSLRKDPYLHVYVSHCARRPHTWCDRDVEPCRQWWSLHTPQMPRICPPGCPNPSAPTDLSRGRSL